MIEELAALATLGFDWADTPDHVWQDSPYHVDGLHDDVIAAIAAGIRDATTSDGPSPIGLVLQGQKGVGKTHLLGMVRRQAHRADGYFFPVYLTSADAFWENTAEALHRGLARADSSGESQLTSFLRRACLHGGVDPDVTKVILSGHGITDADVEAFVAGLRVLDRRVDKQSIDTARALVLYSAEDRAASDIGDDYLGGFEESKVGDRQRWGIRSRPKSAEARVREITHLLALTGPIVLAVDQLDTLIARSAQRTDSHQAEGLLVAEIADGLMRLREVTRRTMTLLACLPGTWRQVREQAADTVPDRFRVLTALGRITDPEIGRALVEKRLGESYRAMDFRPPYSTWPVAPSAFEEPWEQHTPRQLIKRIYGHIESCLRAGRVTELTTFDEDVDQPEVLEPSPAKPDRFAEIDAWFEELRRTADLPVLLDNANEDKVMPQLLSAAMTAWITENGNDNMQWERRIWTGGKELHVSLDHTVDEASDLVDHWAFRVIFASNAVAALSRLRKAHSAAGLGQGADNRHLVLIRNDDWSPGPQTQRALAACLGAGGVRCALPDEDVRTFWALGQMLAKGDNDFHWWLVDRRPASQTALLSAVLPLASFARPSAAAGEITLGTAIDTGEPVRIELAALRKHAVVFAGSGSGKTVLLRRIVEESALHGVSAIVLDPNNDLARLGDAWPSPPEAWGPDDARLAEQYLAETEVVVWTPGRATGRPLAFQPLPDFAGVLDDEDELGAAVEVAVAALAPLVRLTGGARKAKHGLAVLREAVVHHARSGSRSLPGLIGLLAHLPDGVSTLGGGSRIAADLAEDLKAAMVNDPLFAGGGEPVDPGVLLTPGAGRRARVSVISFVGLPAEEQRQNFVNQLQMELFGWIKRNPAADQPLGALFVMDEAQTLASSSPLTASTRSTIVLASQARKYGLGLLFATQAPKGLHNQVVGNAMTQFFGRLNSPTQIAAANDLARAKGSPVADISGLERAQFYVSGEAFGFRKVTTPLCLTHHPASPLRLEEVLERARRSPA